MSHVFWFPTDVPLQEDWSASFNIVCTVANDSSMVPSQCATNENFTPFLAPEELAGSSTATDVFQWNYGFFPRTWGDWTRLETHHGGIPPTRPYPLEVIDISTRTPTLGTIYPVKPLAAFSVVVRNGSEIQLCWKIIAIDARDPLSERIQDLSDVDNLLPGTLNDLKLWISSCQHRASSSEAATLLSLFQRQPASSRETLSIIMQAHASWKLFVAEKGVSLRSPVFKLPNEEPNASFHESEFDYLKSSETIYEQAWATSSPDWGNGEEDNEEEEGEDEDAKSKRRHNRSKSMSFAFAEKKHLDSLDEEEAEYLKRTPSLKETSKKWFKKTISNIVGIRSSAEGKDLKEAIKPQKKTLRTFFRLSSSEAQTDMKVPKETVKSPTENTKPKSRKERVMVQFSEAPKLFRQNTTFDDSRKLLRMDTMPAPNSHTLAMEEFRSGLMRMDSLNMAPFITSASQQLKKQLPLSMEEIVENMSFSDPDSPRAGDRSPEDEPVLPDLSKVDLSHVNDQISRMEKEMENEPGELFRAKTFVPQLGSRSLRNKYGSFSGSLVGPMDMIHGQGVLPVGDSTLETESKSGEEGVAFPILKKQSSGKKIQWSPAMPRAYKAVRGSGFCPKSPSVQRWPPVTASGM